MFYVSQGTLTSRQCDLGQDAGSLCPEHLTCKKAEGGHVYPHGIMMYVMQALRSAHTLSGA